jgi:hypothetical protein
MISIGLKLLLQNVTTPYLVELTFQKAIDDHYLFYPFPTVAYLFIFIFAAVFSFQPKTSVIFCVQTTSSLLMFKKITQQT